MSTSNTIIWPALYRHDQKQDWDSYRNYLIDYFKICKDNSILEIAPFNGTHTDIIKLHSPKSITLVELNDEAITYLKYAHSDCEIIQDDIHFYLEKEHPFDVVVCCGLIYHLHSPLYLLELIVNRTDPKFIIIESYGGANNPPEFRLEEDNSRGNRQILTKWKSAGYNIQFGTEIVINSMKNMGYKLNVMDVSNYKPDIASGCPYFCVFEKL